MKRSGVVASVLVLLMTCGLPSQAMAHNPDGTFTDVLYTIEFVASGTVGTVSFTDEPIVVAGVIDTPTAATLAELAKNVSANSTQLAQILNAASNIAGLGFIIAAIIKFEQHKDNPTRLSLTAEVSFTSPLTKLVVRDGAPVTLSIDSILNDRVEFRTHRIGNLIRGK